VILYNTCSVREHAEQKVWSPARRAAGPQEGRPDVVIGVIGCMAERDGKNIFDRFPHVDILCGPGELDKLPGLVHNAAVPCQDGGEGGGRRTKGGGGRLVLRLPSPVTSRARSR
jgi:tRNA A37 methylthiotransferase MiaB